MNEHTLSGRSTSMMRSSFALGMTFLFAVVTLAQDGIQRGTIKKVDAGQGVLTITIKGEDKDFLVTPETKFMKRPGQEISDGLKNPSFKAGAAVRFKAIEQDRRMMLVGLMLVDKEGQPGGKPGGISSGI